MESRLRTRQVIVAMCYDTLLRESKIPDISSQLKSAIPESKKRYFPFIYKTKDGPSLHGILVEAMLKYTRQVSPVDAQAIERLNLELLEACGTFFDQGELQKKTTFYRDICNSTDSKMAELVGSEFDFSYGEELSYSGISGHPDIVARSRDQPDKIIILDVKTSLSFSKMSCETSLQILAYACLAKLMGYAVDTVGIVAPMQKTVVLCDVSSWDYFDFYSEMEAARVTVLSRLVPSISIPPDVGSHCFVKDLAKYCMSTTNPVQVFINNPRSYRNSNAATAAKCKEIIAEWAGELFVHSPYCTNPCRDSLAVCEETLCQTIKTCVDMGARGVVVHVGALVDSDCSMEKMRENLQLAIEFASEDCPLLLETGCGEGTEVLRFLDEFIDFYLSFKNDPRLGICIDSAHVWAAGYRPAAYLEQWLSRVGRVHLVHFNDSKKEIGSKVDRHAPSGAGYIGSANMLEMYRLCALYKIPCVTE